MFSLDFLMPSAVPDTCGTYSTSATLYENFATSVAEREKELLQVGK